MLLYPTVNLLVQSIVRGEESGARDPAFNAFFPSHFTPIPYSKVIKRTTCTPSITVGGQQTRRTVPLVFSKPGEPSPWFYHGKFSNVTAVPMVCPPTVPATVALWFGAVPVMPYVADPGPSGGDAK